MKRRGRRAGRVSVSFTAPAQPPTGYRAYLRSRWWAEKRAAVLRRARGYCELCYQPSGLRAEVHHLTYERLGRERPSDLLALCPDCHHREHFPDKGAGIDRPLIRTTQAECTTEDGAQTYTAPTVVDRATVRMPVVG